MAALRNISLSTRRIGGRLFSTEPYDVVIVGGGMVGMSLAASLSNDHMCQYLKVAVLDRAPVPDMLSVPLSQVPDSRVWDEAGSGCLRWDAQDIGRDTMGAVLENSVIQSACMRAAANTASQKGSVDFVWPADVQAMKLPPYKFDSAPPESSGASSTSNNEHSSSSSAAADRVQRSQKAAAPGSLAELHLEGGRVLKTRLIVAADGARSRLRDWAELRTFALQYGQCGLVATVACDPNTTAWQRFLKTGPIALLPARGGYSNIVWSTTPEHANSLKKLAPVAFADKVNAAMQSEPLAPVFGNLMPTLGSKSRWEAPPVVHAWAGQAPSAFPLQMRHAGRYVRPRFVLIGDAAHAVHPLAGQGVNLGFGDVSQLTQALSEAVRVGRDVGDVAMLQGDYEQRRMAANTAMMAGLHTIQQLFGVQSPAVAGLRNLGMGLVNEVWPMKNKLMQVAMGDFT